MAVGPGGSTAPDHDDHDDDGDDDGDDDSCGYEQGKPVVEARVISS